MNAKDVLILDALYDPLQQALEKTYTCHKLYEAHDHAAMMSELADKIQVVATHSHAGITQPIIDALPALKLVSHFGVGIDTTDLPACTAAGITVCNTPDVLTEDVADMAVGLTLSAVRQIPQGDRFVRDGHWLKAPMPLTSTLQQRKVGVVGLGRIGQAIAKRCLAFNTDVSYYGPRKKADQPYQYFDNPTALAEWASVLIAACPGGRETAGLISREVLQALGGDGVFVNISRGSVVDEQALTQLLVSGELGSAGLDVFDDEPNVPQALLDLDHIVLQPHQGSASVRTRMAMGQLVIDNIAAWFSGEPLLTPVN